MRSGFSEIYGIAKELIDAQYQSVPFGRDILSLGKLMELCGAVIYAMTTQLLLSYALDDGAVADTVIQNNRKDVTNQITIPNTLTSKPTIRTSD